MCKCINIDIGSYDNQICVDTPIHINYNNSKICIDKCLYDEVEYLWSLGIRTTGCCCGHNKLDGFIGVEFDDIIMMKALGYQVRKNEIRSNDEDSFYPKSIQRIK
jgi:hypothetical protein